ncbi:amino acid/polyamine transporter I [Fusarium avenaceum]|nr:amino acid/polyamine transporter I [Fusarium avenaceum]
MADATAAVPLLHSRQSSYDSTSSKTTPNHDSETAGDIHPSRDVEDDVLPETSAIGRNLSWQSAYVLVISRVVGSGIFATPGTIVQSVGSAGLSLSLWLVGAFIAACGLAVSLEFGCMLPRSGGDKVYLEFAYRRPRLLASTLFAMYAVLLGFTASNCIIFSQYALFAFGVEEASDVLRKSLAVGLLTSVCVIHSVFPKAGIKIQDVLGWVKIGIIVVMILSGFYVVIFRPDTSAAPTGQLAWEHLWEDSSWSWGAIATSLFKVFYSFAGLDNAANVMNEVKHPVRTLRSVALTALATACGMYLLVNVAYFLVVPIEEIRGSGELIAALFFERLFGENFGRIVLPTAVALSAVGNVMVVAFAMARTKQEIARQGFIPYSSVLSSSKPFNSPMGGFVIHYIPSFLVMVLPPSNTIYSLILEIDGYAAQLIGLAVAIGLVKLRSQRPDLKRPFKAWIPAVGVRIIMSCALIAAPFFRPPDYQGEMFYATYAVFSWVIGIVGVVYWYVWTIGVPRWRGTRLEEETDVLDDGTTITRLRYRS